jgi:hypothetical protein
VPSGTRQKLRLYARSIAEIQDRLAPLFQVLIEASRVEPELAVIWKEIADRRSANMRLFAAELADLGALTKASPLNRPRTSSGRQTRLSSTRSSSSCAAGGAINAPNGFGDAWCRLLLDQSLQGRGRLFAGRHQPAATRAEVAIQHSP